MRSRRGTLPQSIAFTRTSRPRLWVVLACLAAALIVGLVAGAVVWLGQSRKPHQRLPDGTEVVLEAVTYGRSHDFDARTWWERFLTRPPIRPTGFVNHSPSFTTPRNSLSFWLSQRFASRGGGYAVLTDEHGCWFEPTTSDWGMYRQGRTYPQLYQAGFETYPRHSRQLHLGLYDSYGKGPVASFTVPNPETPVPLSGGAPGQPLPLTVRRGGRAFTLLRLVHRNVNLHRREAAFFQVTENGRDAPEWQPFSLILRDGCGNVSVNRTGPLRDGSVRFAGLCRYEPVWILQVQFARKAPAGERRSESVEFRVRP